MGGKKRCRKKSKILCKIPIYIKKERERGGQKRLKTKSIFLISTTILSKEGKNPGGSKKYLKNLLKIERKKGEEERTTEKGLRKIK